MDDARALQGSGLRCPHRRADRPREWKFRVVVEPCDPGDAVGGGRSGGAGDPGRRCTYEVTRPDLEPFTLEGTRDDEVSGSVDIEGRDYLVVSVGDSMSSGEGAPYGAANGTTRRAIVRRRRRRPWRPRLLEQSSRSSRR